MDNPETHSLDYPCLCPVSCVLSATCVSGLSMSLSCVLCIRCYVCLWIIHVFVLCLVWHLTHKTQDKDMDNPETHVALNTQDRGQRYG
jgi:hypothetical protein